MAIETQPKVFCLFHQKTDCNCINPVTNKNVLNMRLEHAIKLNDRNNKFESNEELKLAREKETADWRARISEMLENPSK